ncbi:carbon-nitrogen hydrolase family protein [Nocardiopsis changdeensis]|uniref:Carbon-nitrogen hydrolase family protein n=1 Tax=Nocardiopsis changdeensis TaxID=2831969 RepID=A0ABX8BQB1_9ACTN|nr:MULTISPECIES: carbon-nitrogen hydrolase family protein [Nocardiopsis]QUX23913.1 carbon-nitrogen hydrolase family protein [Nocardiopsis changdeensis]QYX39859.1 carbon-nitrogen hydrolase family protein [Nocardiopsis sp. MT53]
MVQVAVAQFAPAQDKAENLRSVGRLAARAAALGARVVLLPEYTMFTASRTDGRYVEAAEPLDGPFVAAAADTARREGVHLVLGVNEETAGGTHFSNTLVALSPRGERVALYRKIHLYDAFGVRESDVVAPGPVEEPETFTVEGVTFGLQTCYDLRFPEVTRRIADAGAHVVLLAAQWVPGPLKEEHWRTLARARAVENTVYVAAAGQSAPTGAGNSMVVDPMGTPIAALGEQGFEVAVAEVSASRVDEVRTTNPALAMRRFVVVPRD